MRPEDLLRGAVDSLRLDVVRASLGIVMFVIGVFSVVLLVSFGEGIRVKVHEQFGAVGGDLVVAIPGRTETLGATPSLSGTTRDLTLDDVIAISRSRAVEEVCPISIGTAHVSHAQRGRDVLVLGVTEAFGRIRHIDMEAGRFLPAQESTRRSRTCVLGSKVAREIFGDAKVVNQRVRIGESAFRVIGVIATMGMQIGLDMDDLAMIPVADALKLFNRDGLSRIVVRAHSAEGLDATAEETRRILKERHDGDEDFTIIDPGTVLAALNRVLGFVTTAVALIASISLIVCGVMITNLQLVAVAERTGEIGLRRAVGAQRLDIALHFMLEALLLAVVGCAIGWGLAAIVGETLRVLVPRLPISVTAWSAELAFVFCVLVAILAGIYPAVRAARLDPARALARR